MSEARLWVQLMAAAPVVGCAELAFRVDVGWEQLPEGYDHRDVVGIAVDSVDRVYVFNRSQHPVMVFKPSGEFLGSWGEGVFNTPHGISIDKNDVVYCSDHSDHTVRKFTSGGTLLQVLGRPGVGSDSGVVGSDYRTIREGAPPFNGPTKTAVTLSGDVLVSDGYGNARIHRFTQDGILRWSWGEPGAAPGQFNLPHSVAVDLADRVLVADRENGRVQRFTGNGEFIDEWTGLARPTDIAIDESGFVFVTELGPAGAFSYTAPFPPHYPPSRISVFDSEGTLITRWGSRRRPCAPGSFFAAHGVCADSRGDLYVGEVNYTATRDEFDRPIRAHRLFESAPVGCHTLQKFVRIAAER